MGFREEVKRLVDTESAAHKRLIEYVVRQLKAGRPLSAVFEDPYVTNRLAPSTGGRCWRSRRWSRRPAARRCSSACATELEALASR